MFKVFDSIVIASDHRGYQLKKDLISLCGVEGILDLGCGAEDTAVDYPDYACALARKMLQEHEMGNKVMGVLLCGSGVGMSICANRFVHIRAALCCDVDVALSARRHNDANVLVLGADDTNVKKAIRCFNVFTNTEFQGQHYSARVDKLSSVEILMKCY